MRCLDWNGRRLTPMPVATTQATGKIHKLAQLAGVLLICASPVACQAGALGTGEWLVIAGALLWGGGRFTGWLFHG